MQLVVGVDGGNTKTTALLAELSGTVVGAGRSGCSDIYGARRPRAAIDAVCEAIDAAASQARSSRQDIVFGAFSLAGADWPEDFDYYYRALRRRVICDSLVVVNDAIGALKADTYEGVGVVVSCGTWGAVGARGLDGTSWHSSFWIEASGAAQIGLDGLRAVYRAALGIDPPTTLRERMLSIFDSADETELLHRFTRRRGQLSQEHAAEACPAVLDEAETGDAVARVIVERHGSLLGRYALAAADRVRLSTTPFRVTLVGGVFAHPSRLLAEAIEAVVHQRSPTAEVGLSPHPPVVGALLMALEGADVALSHQVIERLSKSLPGVPFFDTRSVRSLSWAE